jgi:putative NADH-flavin reductase
MNITVVCAAGRAGRLIVEEAVSRGHNVKAVIRKEADKAKINPKAEIIFKDLMELTYDDVADADVVIDAFGTFAPESMSQYTTTLDYLSDLLAGKGKRLMVVGGAATLYTDDSLKTRLLDTPDFPDAYKPVATAMAAAFEKLKTRKDVDWTFVSPPAFFDAEGERTGEYQLGGDVLVVNSKGESTGSYADYAIAMIDVAEGDNYIQQRISVCSK